MTPGGGLDRSLWNKSSPRNCVLVVGDSFPLEFPFYFVFSDQLIANKERVVLKVYAVEVNSILVHHVFV